MNGSVQSPVARTDWEAVAETRWGKYITELEQTALLRAASVAPVPHNFLEVGCDRGRWAQILVREGWQATCTDIDPEAIDICRQRVPSAEVIHVSPDSKTLPGNDGAYSLVVCIEVPAVMESGWFLGESFRVLRPHGIMVGTMHNRRSWKAIPSRFLRSKRFYGVAYTEWRRRLREAGFSVLQEIGFAWPPFSRASNSRLIGVSARIERLLDLHQIPAFSPWIAVAAMKRQGDWNASHQ